MAAKKKAKKTIAKKAAKAPAKKKAASKRRAAKKAASKKRAAPKKVSTAIPIVHWEIQTQNAEALHGFYGDLFGWTINANNPMKYGMVDSAGQGGINGG